MIPSEKTHKQEKVVAIQQYCQEILGARKNGLMSDQEAAQKINHATIFLDFGELEKGGVSQKTIEALKDIGDMAGDLELGDTRPLSYYETEKLWVSIEQSVDSL